MLKRNENIISDGLNAFTKSLRLAATGLALVGSIAVVGAVSVV